MDTQDVQGSRSGTSGWDNSSAPPAQDRSTQASQARSAEGLSPSRSARPAAPAKRPGDGASLSAETEEPSSSDASGLVAGMHSWAFEHQGDDSYLGGQAETHPETGGLGATGQFQASRGDFHGAGEGKAFVGAQPNRVGAFAEGQAQGVNGDQEWSARGKASLGVEASRTGIQAGLNVQGSLTHGADTDSLGLSSGVGVHADGHYTNNANELSIGGGVQASEGTQLTYRHAHTSQTDNGSSFTREGVVAVGPGNTAEAGASFGRDRVNGTTTLGGNLVVPTPFGGIGGRASLTVSDQDLHDWTHRIFH